jgi:hypothetical protein
MEGKDGTRSLPKANAPLMDEADTRGFKWALNPDTYWCSFTTMTHYFIDILVPWFNQAKRRLKLPKNQTCIVFLDVWSVHRSIQFRTWVKTTYPWIELHYVPGGCTGLFQPCDVGMQRPFKQAIKLAQLADTVATTLKHLSSKSGEGSAVFKLDVTIGELRKQCPRWFVQAFDTIQRPDLVRAAFERCRVPNLDLKSTEKPRFNLSFDCLTSADAIGHLLGEIRDNDPTFWAELLSPQTDVEIKAPQPSTLDESPFDEDLNKDLDDSSAHPSELIDEFLTDTPSPPLVANVDLEDMADDLDADLDLDPEEIALAAVSGRDRGVGKRVVKPRRLYDMDKYDRKPGKGGEVTARSRVAKK